MKDRIVEHPNRFRLNPVVGENGVYDIEPMPGVITEVGTPINKATLLSDETVACLGLPQADPNVDDALKNCIVKGMILLWSGSSNEIPKGWALCNGGSGTPNLTNRFIVGAGTSYAVGATGGSDSIALTIAQIPSHTHTISADGAHIHDIATSFYDGGNGYFAPRATGYKPGDQNWTTSSSSSHTHTIGSVGSGSGHENRPPYYALCYIMKL